MSNPIDATEILAPEAEERFKTPVIDAITQAEVDVAIATAKKYPRNLRTFQDSVTSYATLDEETAASCYFSIRRQGKTIQGESVRLAEIAISQYGNIRAGARVLGESEDGKFIRAMGVCHDLEKNVYVAIEAQRRITNRDGKRYSDDMIGVTANAAASIAFRNAAFRVIPKAFLRQAYLQAKRVASGDAKTLKEKREQVLARLVALNPLITEDRVLASIGKPSVDDITLDDVTHLIGLGTAIRDGNTTIEEAFPEVEEKGAVNAAAIKQEAAARKAKPEVDSEGVAAEKGDTTDTNGGEQGSLVGVQLSEAQIKELKAVAKRAKVSWSEVEERFAGGPLEEYIADGRSANAIEMEVVDLIKRMKAEEAGE